MIKPGVKARGLQPEIALAVAEAREVYRGIGVELVITSLLDGKHMSGSKHYEGQAVDLRTRHIPAEDRALVTARLREALGPEYDVCLESDHLHIEFDPPQEK